MLQPFVVNAPANGILKSSLASGAQVSRGTLIGRIQTADNQLLELRSPLLGKVDARVAANGSNLTKGDAVLTIKSDEQSLWEALRGLSVVGRREDLPLIEKFANGAESPTDRVKQQAALTANAIKSRSG